MFKFDFDLAEEDIDNDFTTSSAEQISKAVEEGEKSSSPKTFEELPLESLVSFYRNIHTSRNVYEH